MSSYCHRLRSYFGPVDDIYLVQSSCSHCHRSIGEHAEGPCAVPVERMGVRCPCCGKWPEDHRRGSSAARPDCFQPQPKGFRDLYWCWIINEPEIVIGPNDSPTCPSCGHSVMDLADSHTFIAHVLKPRDDDK
jgi:hypothetical protein